MEKKSRQSADSAGQLFDQYLVVLVQSGDRAAAERLAKRWHPRLVRAARRYLADPFEAEILAQECWLAVLKGIGKLRDPARFAPWAFGILRRRGADRIKSAVKERDAFTDGDPPESPMSARQEDAFAIAQAFALLPPEHRLTAHLHFTEGLTLREIAEATDIPLGTAKSRLFHARRQLKAALSPIQEENTP